MDGSTAVWLALTLAAPVTLVPEIALLRLLHSRRAGWYPLDVLFVSLLVAQLCCTLVTFGLSATSLLKSAGITFLLSEEEEASPRPAITPPLCAALVSCWAAAHTLHAATLSSLAVDRAMTLRWPYKYRLSVRRTQVRYHVVVLAVISILVGIAGLFAGSNPSGLDGGCNFLPYTFDSRFSLFWLSLHGLLLGATLAAAVVIFFSCCGGASSTTGSGSDMRTLGNVSEGSSSATIQGPPRYCSRPLHVINPALNHPSPALMFESKEKSSAVELYGSVVAAAAAENSGSGWNRQRHSTVAAVLIVAYLTHHLPLLVLTTLGTYFSDILPADWPYSAMVLSSSLLSGLLFMAVLVFIDPVTHGWMVDSLRPSSERRRRRHHRHSPVTCSEATTLEQQQQQHPADPPKMEEEENRYRMSQIYDPAGGKFPLTNGSLFVHLMNPSGGTTSSSESRTTIEGEANNRRPSRMGISAYDRHHFVGYPPPPLQEGMIKPALLSTFMSRSKILMMAAAANNESNERSLQSHQEPIYASLSETLSSACNTLDSRSKEILEDDEGSATESAGDDFEFHNIRSSRQTLIPTEAQTSPDPVSTFGLEDLKPRSRIARSATYRILCNGLDVKCAKREEEDSALSTAVSQSRHGLVTCVTIQVDDKSLLERRPSSKRLTSLSMNDLDHIGHNSDTDHDGCYDEDGLPARKSDSLFSLPSGEEIKVEEEGLSRSSIELSKKPHYRRQEPHAKGMLHLRKQQGRFLRQQQHRDNGIVTIAALKAALSQSAVSYLDTGDTLDHIQKKRAVFVSEYL